MRDFKGKFRSFRSRAILAVLGFGMATVAFSGPREQANRLHQRLTGIAPTTATLDTMEALIKSGKAKEAAYEAMKNVEFLNRTVFDMFAATSNEDDNSRVGLSDYMATIIGAVRDDLAFDTVLYDDLIYLAPAGSPAWSPRNNDMYEAIEGNVDFASSLVKSTQSAVLPVAMNLPATFNDFAGIFTTRGFAAAYYIDGTNRAALRYSAKAFLCKDIDKLMDTNISDIYVRQDVSRSPGGNSKVYKTECAGCHAGMDPLVSAFAYFNSTMDGNDILYSITPGKVQPKYFINSGNYPEGHRTVDNTWRNLWVEGSNKSLGWKGPTTGKGVKSYGKLYAGTRAFSECMAKRTYAKTCLTDWSIESGDHITELANNFEKNGYKLKDLFAEASVKCMGK